MFEDIVKNFSGKLDPMGILGFAINYVPNGKGKELADQALKTVQGGATPASFMDAIENFTPMLEGIVPDAGKRIEYLKNHSLWKELRKRSGNKEEIVEWGEKLLNHLKFTKNNG